MIWASVLAGIALAIGSLIALVWALHIVLGTVKDALETLERDRLRSQEHEKSLLDRLMSGDWEAVRAHDEAKDQTDGGFFTPDESEEPKVEMETRSWGRLGPMRDRFEATEDEQALLDEDFPELNRENR